MRLLSKLSLIILIQALVSSCGTSTVDRKISSSERDLESFINEIEGSYEASRGSQAFPFPSKMIIERKGSGSGLEIVVRDEINGGRGSSVGDEACPIDGNSTGQKFSANG